MSVTYRLGPGVLKISPEASVFLANQMWLGKEQYGVSPGTIVVNANSMVFKKFGMTLGYIDFVKTPLFLSDGILYHMGVPEPPLCSQAKIWAIELNNS